MGLWDIRPFSSARGGTTTVRCGPMTAGQGFLPGEPIMLADAGTLSTCVKDGTEILLADSDGGVFGLAINGPGAAASAELVAADGWGRLWNHPDSGDSYAATTDYGALGSPKIWYIPFGLPDQLFITDNIVVAGGAAAGAALTGADRGESFQITYVSATTPDLGWGLERTAGVPGTDVVARVVDVLDARMRPVTIAGTGVWAVFQTIV